MMAIGEGVARTHPARHSYVADVVTVGFFTGPTVCIGCLPSHSLPKTFRVPTRALARV
jgi:hypothetical protein